MIVLVIGGSASGKSAYAETRLQQMQAARKYYIATMQVWDSEGEKRVKKHPFGCFFVACFKVSTRLALIQPTRTGI